MSMIISHAIKMAKYILLNQVQTIFFLSKIKKIKVENEIWCILLEKAFAKVFGSYSKHNGGDSSEIFKYMTGAPLK